MEDGNKLISAAVSLDREVPHVLTILKEVRRTGFVIKEPFRNEVGHDQPRDFAPPNVRARIKPWVTSGSNHVTHIAAAIIVTVSRSHPR